MEATSSQISLSNLQTALAGRYAFERELGRGGMAVVFLARDLEHDRPVAVKVLLPELAATLGQDRFLREIEVGRVLQHPRIVGVLDSGQAEGLLYYVMPFVDGASLRDRIDREKQLAVDDAIEIIRQVADALAFAHSKGVIHRDIKPENILLDKTGALVADFGIARAVSVAGGETLTKTGMAVGTPTYMSPEQAMGSKDVTPESDIYSLACVMYEMLAGQPPFTGPTAMALLARHSLDNVPSLKIVRNTIPDAVEDAIVRAMAKVPADRFRNAMDFANALADHEGAARRRADSIKAKAIAAQTVEVSALGAKRKKTAMIAAAVVVPLLGVGGWFGWKATQAPASPEGLSGDFAKSNIAVMYFQDRSQGGQMAYLADGLTEALINELSSVKALKVISQNGVAPFKGKTPPSDSVARVLRVGTLVTGTVSPAAGGRLRVDVQLVDALNNEQLASTRAEQTPDRLLEIQDSLARNISLFLRERVGQEIEELTSRAGTRNAAAWDAMQRARQTGKQIDALVTARDIKAALAKIQETDAALASVEKIDGNWSEPIVERAWLGYRAARLVGSSDANFRKYVSDGLAHADRALAKAPNDPNAVEARGTLHYWQFINNLAPDPAAARALLASAEKDLVAVTTAIPRRATAWNVLSHLRINKGELTQAVLDARAAYEADPYLSDVDRTIYRLFTTNLDLGIREEAAKWCAEGQGRFPGAYRFVQCKLWLYALPGPKPDMAEVWKTYEEWVKASPANQQEFDKLKGRIMVALAFVQADQPDSATALAEANLGNARIDPRGELTHLAAIVFAQVGDKDRAFDLLRKYLAANPQLGATPASDKSWWLDPLKSDPRYKQLVQGSS